MAPSLTKPARSLYRLSRLVSRHWVATIALLLFLGLLGGLIAYVIGDGWNSVSVFQTCYGVVLAIGIFTWSLSGYAAQKADRRGRGATKFAKEVQGKNFGPGKLDVYRPALAKFLDVPEDEVEGELLMWLVQNSGVQGPQDLLAITQRHWFIRVRGRGRAGWKVTDLSA